MPTIASIAGAVSDARRRLRPQPSPYQRITRYKDIAQITFSPYAVKNFKLISINKETA